MASRENHEFRPGMTGVSVGPNRQPADVGVPKPTRDPAAATSSSPGPEHLTDEAIRKDQEARTGRDGLGSAGVIRADQC